MDGKLIGYNGGNVVFINTKRELRVIGKLGILELLSIKFYYGINIRKFYSEQTEKKVEIEGRIKREGGVAVNT